MPPTGTGRQPSEYLSHVPSRPPLPRRAKKGGRPQRRLPPIPVLPPLSAATGTGLAAAGDVLPQGNGGRKESTQKTATSPRPQDERFAATAAGHDLRSLPFRGRNNVAFASESLTEPHRARTCRTGLFECRSPATRSGRSRTSGSIFVPSSRHSACASAATKRPAASFPTGKRTEAGSARPPLPSGASDRRLSQEDRARPLRTRGRASGPCGRTRTDEQERTTTRRRSSPADGRPTEHIPPMRPDGLRNKVAGNVGKSGENRYF